MEPHHIHIEHLHDDPTHSPCGSYSSSETLEDELDQDRLNRLSSTSTSTLVGANGTSGNNSRSSSPFDQEVKINPTSRSSSPSSSASHQRGLWYRFTHSEAGRVFSAFCYFTFVCISMAFCNQLSDHRWVETGYTQVLLRDRGFDVIAPQSDIGPANFFVMTSVVLTVLGIGFICPTWTMRAVVLRRCLWVIGSLSVYRALTISVTTLPSPKEECRPSLKYGFWDMLVIAIQMIPGTVEACTDDIFSGHTVFMVSCAIQWRLYCKNKWVTYFSYLYISVGLYFVVATRLHYTVDVVLAIFLTYGFWSVYIAMIDVVMEREYFGIQSHNEKYSAFDSTSTDYEFSSYDNDDLSTRHQSDFHIRRRRLEHQMNRIRGPGIGYGRGEYDRVAFVPMQLNVWLINIVRWCDGLDLRMRQDMPAASKNSTRWEDLVVRYRSGRSTPASDSTAVTPCSSANCCHRKSEADLYDRRNENGSEMVQLYHPNDVNAPLTGGLDDVCNCADDDYNNSDNGQQEHFGRWRSLPLRSGSSRQRSSNHKEDKYGSKDRDRKLHIIKVALIVFVNTILLVKIVEAYQGRSTAPPPPAHQEINAINNTLHPDTPTAVYHPPQAQDIDATATTASMYKAIANDEVNSSDKFYSPQAIRRRPNRPTEEPEGTI
ncbi:hypothetical protein K457DRAFT_281204 [Linnemannia elongata AG-77]|uniref:Sphingomyelin synthase-like domain-containing protein n=1 Tax=Linnemannia elongata AG-77 TaxID=1314771 RepID=A0A197JCC6_9FUNG|nr:hypothetical protein K457DRAFT_281204 [Linnemannia elongata AG-77]